MGRDQADNPLHVGRRQPCAGVDPPLAKPVQPECAIGIDHDFDDHGIVKRSGDFRSHCRAQHVAAAVPAFGLTRKRAHSAASAFAAGVRDTPSGVILATTSAAVRLPAAKRRPT